MVVGTMTTLLFALRPHTTSSACAIQPTWSELSSNVQTDGVCGCPVFFPRLHPHTRCGSVIGGCCRVHATGGFFEGEASEEGGCRGHAADWHCWTWMGVRRYLLSLSVHHGRAHDVKCHPADSRIASHSASWASPPLHTSQLPAYTRLCETVSSRFFVHILAFGRPRPEGMNTTKCPNSVISRFHTASACSEATEAPEPLCPVLLPHSVPASHTKAMEQGRHRDRPMPPRAAPAEHTQDRILFIHSCSRH